MFNRVNIYNNYYFSNPFAGCYCNYNYFNNSLLQLGMMTSLFNLMQQSLFYTNYNSQQYNRYPSYNDNYYTNSYENNSSTPYQNTYTSYYPSTYSSSYSAQPEIPSFTPYYSIPEINFDIEVANVKPEKDHYRPKIDKTFKNPQKLDAAFLNRVKQIAKKLNCDYRDLLAVMNCESGLKTTAWNGKTAVGLIQFTQIVIDDLNDRYHLNLTKSKISQMTPMQQLDIAEKALVLAKGYAFGTNSNKRLSGADLYAITFLPGRAKRSTLCRKGESYYNSNKGLDLNKDGKITKAELGHKVANHHVNESIFA